MPTYPTGAQNLDLLESLKENYSQYMPGYQGDPNSVTDFMRHLGGQGVEGMGVGKENRADLLGLNQPNLAQPEVANDVQTMAPIEVTALEGPPATPALTAFIAPIFPLIAFPNPAVVILPISLGPQLEPIPLNTKGCLDAN